MIKLPQAPKQPGKKASLGQWKAHLEHLKEWVHVFEQVQSYSSHKHAVRNMEMGMSEREKDVKARYDSLTSGDKARLNEEWRAQGVLQAPPRERLLRMDESLRRLGNLKEIGQDGEFHPPKFNRQRRNKHPFPKNAIQRKQKR